MKIQFTLTLDDDQMKRHDMDQFLVDCRFALIGAVMTYKNGKYRSADSVDYEFHTEIIKD